jgi:hypothetical protein
MLAVRFVGHFSHESTVTGPGSWVVREVPDASPTR